MAYLFPNKIFPSNINNYLLCPLKFKCYNDKDLKPEFIENPQNFTGKVMHAVLRDIFDIVKIPTNLRKSQNIGEMVRRAWARMTKGNFSKDYWTIEERVKLFGSQEQEREFGLQTIVILNNYIAKADLSAVPLSLEDWMDCEIGEFRIGGQIDRIDQESNDSLAVWDYKTGKLPFYDSVDKMIKNDLQLPIYAIIASKHNPFAEKIRVGLIYVKYSRIFDVVWTKEELKSIEERVISEIKKAQADTKFSSRINSLCPWCDYKKLCPEKDKIKENQKEVDEVNW